MLTSWQILSSGWTFFDTIPEANKNSFVTSYGHFVLSVSTYLPTQKRKLATLLAHARRVLILAPSDLLSMKTHQRNEIQTSPSDVNLTYGRQLVYGLQYASERNCGVLLSMAFSSRWRSSLQSCLIRIVILKTAMTY